MTVLVRERVCVTCRDSRCEHPKVPVELVDWVRVVEAGFDDDVSELGPSTFARSIVEHQRTTTSLDAGVSAEPFRCSDVVEIAGLLPGADDGPPWVAMFRLADGRWAYVCYMFEVTGDLWWTYIFAATRHRLWWWGCTDDDRRRFTELLGEDEQADELVQLDMLLESSVYANRALAQRRLNQLLEMGRLAR
jgi:hypothetical protein